MPQPSSTLPGCVPYNGPQYSPYGQQPMLTPSESAPQPRPTQGYLMMPNMPQVPPTITPPLGQQSYAPQAQPQQPTYHQQ
jgi:hypothetical protein